MDWENMRMGEKRSKQRPGGCWKGRGEVCARGGAPQRREKGTGGDTSDNGRHRGSSRVMLQEQEGGCSGRRQLGRRRAEPRQGSPGACTRCATASPLVGRVLAG